MVRRPGLAGVELLAGSSDSNVPSGPPATLHEPPGIDSPRFDPKHLVVETWVHRLPARVKHLGQTADFYAPWPPWLNRCEVINDEGDLRVLVNVAPLFPFGEVMSADVDRVVLRVVAKRQRNDVRLIFRADGRQPAQALAVQVFDLVRGKYAQRCTDPRPARAVEYSAGPAPAVDGRSNA
jgi:hypothetical protein